MIFTKTNGHKNEKVWFYDMQNDGYTLNDNRTPCDGSEIPDILERFKNLDKETKRTRRDKSFFVQIEEIENNDFDLSINRYKETIYETINYDTPDKILEDLEKIDSKVSLGLKELKELING